MIKISLAQINIIPGDIVTNLNIILEQIKTAKQKGVDILVFPEMCVGGYMLGDEWENLSFVQELENANEIIKSNTSGIVVIWGNVKLDYEKKGEDGRMRKYNSIFIAQNKKFLSNDIFEGYTYKSLLPKYREFDDARHFFSLKDWKIENNMKFEYIMRPFPVTIRGKIFKLGLTICEDMWHEDYAFNPSKYLVENGAQCLFNISCSPWTQGKNRKRHQVVKKLLAELGVPLFYCNNVGIQNNGKNIFVFDGRSTIYNSAGDIVKEACRFESATLNIELNNFLDNYSDQRQFPLRHDQTKNLYDSLIFGLREFFENLGNPNVVVGISGGIDSALVSALLVKSIGAKKVIGVNMPTMFNSSITKEASCHLAKNLGIKYFVLPLDVSIENTILQVGNTKGIDFCQNKETQIPPLSDIDHENIQARDRSSRILAALASAFGGVFSNNGNKTETAFGYATLYGDICGAIAPIGDLYKGQVYELAKYINKQSDQSIIPEETLILTPSAELSASQDVSKGLGDPLIYPYHDMLARAFIEWRHDPEKILFDYQSGELAGKFGLDNQLLKEIFPTDFEFILDLEEKWKLYKRSVFKRIQSPPLICISKRAFGFDLRESQNRAYFTQGFLSLKEKILRI